MKKVMILVAAVILFAAGTARADLVYSNALASWDNNGQPGSQAYTLGVGSSNVTAANLERGPGLSGSAAAGAISATGWNVAGRYFQFGFTVASGYTATLADLFMGTRSSASGPGTMGVYYSTDGFATSNLLTSITQPSATYVNSDINLSGIGPVQGTLTFRLMEIGTNAADPVTYPGGTQSGGTFRVSSYYPAGVYTANQITGTVVQNAVPIPAAAWLLGSGLVGLVGIRKRMK